MPRTLFYALAFLLLTAIVAGVHTYIWRRVVRDTGLKGAIRKLVTGMVVLGALVVPATLALARRLPRDYVEWLAIAAFLWMGGLMYFVLSLLPWDVWLSFRKRVQRQPEMEPGRRLFLARAAAGAAAVTTTGMVSIGLSNAMGEVETQEISVELARLPKTLDGLRIVQLTDVHIGPLLDGRFLDGIVEKANALKPDLVVITGDLVDGSVAHIGPDVARLARLQSRWGTYFCTGNHEYYSGADEWLAFLKKHGIRSLTNERLEIGDKGGTFDLAGIPDRQGRVFVDSHIPNMEGTLQGRDPDRELVLLSHRPNPIHEAARLGVGLQLSGHTHGGQLWPITAATKLVHPYSSGLHHHNRKTWIYVSRGTGFWGPPMRILAPAEITSITLTSGLA